MRTLIIVPTHNEAANVAELLARIGEHVPEVDIVVIDDGSTDGTGEIVASVAAEDARVRLVERPVKQGLGSAYIHGFGIGIDDGYDLLVQIDADLSHDPADLPTMIELARRGIDIVIGSRYIPGGAVVGWPRRRTWLSRWGNRYAAIVLGLAINDATAGFRVYRTETVAALDLERVQAGGYGFQIEMAYRGIRSGARVVEIPVIFHDRVAGSSKMNRSIILEAFRLVTVWGLADLVTLRRRRRAYRSVDER